ncbi:type II secretion system F family protein [Actinotalea sp.]|uniref:type II secretion system F family protein n=1 Tax=Actinotalea sp. TaxID=1872145 RepID=UPI00356AC72B
MTREVRALAAGALLTGVADALRSGASAEDAWRRVGVIVRDGVPTASSLSAATGDLSVASAVLAAARLAHELGASAAPVLDAVLDSAEQDADAALRRDTALAGPAASAQVLTWLPLLGLLLGLALGADPVAVLLDPDGGWVLLLGGLGSAVLGRGWSRRLVRIARAAGSPPDGIARSPDGGWSGLTARASVPGRVRALGARTGARGVVGGRGGVTGPPRTSEVEVTLVLDLVAAAVASGASVPRTLAAVGAAAGGERGAVLAEIGAELGWGASWAESWAGRDPVLDPVGRALRASWEDGASPVAGARAAARALRRAQQAQALAAAERLGVRLLLPLALCHLPAFVLLGIAPVLVSFVGSGTAS